jgi:hypothetical protein
MANVDPQVPTFTRAAYQEIMEQIENGIWQGPVPDCYPLPDTHSEEALHKAAFLRCIMQEAPASETPFHGGSQQQHTQRGVAGASSLSQTDSKAALVQQPNASVSMRSGDQKARNIRQQPVVLDMRIQQGEAGMTIQILAGGKVLFSEATNRSQQQCVQQVPTGNIVVNLESRSEAGVTINLIWNESEGGVNFTPMHTSVLNDLTQPIGNATQGIGNVAQGVQHANSNGTQIGARDIGLNPAANPTAYSGMSNSIAENLASNPSNMWEFHTGVEGSAFTKPNANFQVGNWNGKVEPASQTSEPLDIGMKKELAERQVDEQSLRAGSSVMNAFQQNFMPKSRGEDSGILRLLAQNGKDIQPSRPQRARKRSVGTMNFAGKDSLDEVNILLHQCQRLGTKAHHDANMKRALNPLPRLIQARSQQDKVLNQRGRERPVASLYKNGIWTNSGMFAPLSPTLSAEL